MYTSLDLLSKQVVAKLSDAGLDELRIHPDFYTKSNWGKLSLLKEFKGGTGIEIPAIPGASKDIQELLDIAPVDFFVFNELEYSETHEKEYAEKGLFCKNESSYAIKGSKEMILRLMIKNPVKRIHFCTAKLKDATQMSNRFKLRAEKVCMSYQHMHENGTILRGVIKNISSKEVIKELDNTFYVPHKLYHIIDASTVEIAPWVLIDLQKDLGGVKSLITQYPTWDSLVVEEEILN